MTKLYLRRALIITLAAIAILAFTFWEQLPETALAQHRSESRTEKRNTATKSKSKPKPAATPAPARSQNAQPQINADGSVVGSPWIGEAGVTETTAEIMSRELAARAGNEQLVRFQNGDRESRNIRPNRKNLPQNLEVLPGAQWPPADLNRAGNQADSATLPLAFSPTLSFTAATLADTGAFPPDTMGAVGPTQFLLAVNGRIRVFNKNTGAVGELDTGIDSFFNSVRGGEFTTDPRVRYDRLSGRWFVVIINVASGNNRLMLAVSDGATITSATNWHFYFFQQNLVTPSGDNGCFADYPSLGIDANALYIGVNQFCSRAFTNTTAYVVRKSSVVNGGVIVVSAFRNLIDTSGGLLRNGIFTPQGVDNNDPNATEGYFIGTDANSFGRLVLRRVSNPGGVPVISPNLYINVLATSAPITVRHRANNNGVNGRLDAIDDRLFMAYYRQGSIWTTHNISVSNQGLTDGQNTRNGARWYEVTDVGSSAPRLAQAGTLFAQTETNTEDERNYFIPSLMVSGQGHMLLGCNLAGTTEFVNAAVAGRLTTDPLGTLQSAQLVTASPGPYNPSANSGNQQGRRRWGDYSFTSLDPCDDMTMWTVQQFCDATGSYGLRAVKIAAPPPAMPTAVRPVAVAAGLTSVNVMVTGLSVNGSGFYDPGDAFGCRLKAAVSGGVAVNSVSYINPTTVVLNLSTIVATAGTKTITITNPDGQIATGDNILTVGNCSYNVVANAQDFAASGGTGTVNVETASACGWTAVSNSNFITINSGGFGSGNGIASFTVAPTVGIARTGTITVAGQTITITQSAGSGCSYSLSPSGKAFPASGGSGSFNVTTASECGWAAVSKDAFVSIFFSSTTQGNGTVSFIVAANDQPLARTGTIDVGGRLFTVTQDAAPFELSVDDGSFETSSGVSAGGSSYRVNRLTPTFYPATLNAIAVYFPDNASVKVGDQFTVVTGINSDGDANIDGTIFQTTSAQVQRLGDFSVVAVPALTVAQGDFVVGIQLTQAANIFPFALDTTKPRGRSYRSLDGSTFTTIESLGTAGNYGIRARLVRPPKLIVGAGISLLLESCQPSNRAIDPGETVTVNLLLGNNGSNSTQNLTATLLTNSNVMTSDQAKSYGVLVPGAPAIGRQFTFTASGACGAVIPVTLSLKDGSEDLGTVTFNVTLGAMGTTTQTFSYSGAAMKIPDGDARGVSVPITISGFNSNIADLNFRIDGTDCNANQGATTVGVDHSWVGDLVFRLTSPAGTTVTIINRAGGGGNSGKNFCQTVLDDDAANASSISSISSSGPPPSGPPYTGTFKPANSLSAFDGENPNGTWTLTVIDDFTGDSGNVRAFSLVLTGFACCSTGCLDVAGMSASSGAIGSQVTINGSGFSGVSAVKFGDVPAAFTVNSNTSITATVPAGARNAPVVLSKPGCVDAQTLTFMAFPVMTLTPATLTVAAGSPGAMTINLSYPQSNATTVTLTSSNSLLASVPASVMIPAGVATADFQVNGIALGGPLTMTAKLPAALGGASAFASASVVARTVTLVSTAGSIGRTVSVPVVLESKGDETIINFSLSYDSTKLVNPQIVAGEDSGAVQLNLNTSLLSQGRIGVTISKPVGQKFAAGLRQIAIINFEVPGTTLPAVVPLEFGDEPTTRSVGNITGATIITQFVSSSVRLGQGYESDVTPRPLGNNNGNVTITDWVLIGRFVAGLDTPANGNEFQRADSSPKETFGDGKLTLTDWVQAGRYVAGLDAATVAGGPTAPTASAIANCGLGNVDCKLNLTQSIRADDAIRNLKMKTSGSVLTATFNASGTENALGFSVGFDPKQWRFVQAKAGQDMSRATVIVNSTAASQGRVGVMLALPSEQALHMGENETVILEFAPRGRSGKSKLEVEILKAPIAPEVVDFRARRF